MLVSKSLKFIQCQSLVIRINILKTPEMVKLAQCYHLYLPTKTGPRTLTFSIMLACMHTYIIHKNIHEKNDVLLCGHIVITVFMIFLRSLLQLFTCFELSLSCYLEYEIKILYTGIIKILKFTQSLLFNSSHDDQHNSSWENRRHQYPANHSIGV